MRLRVLLVALVAALGMDLPGSDDLEAWGRSGRAWLASRMDDLSSFRAEAGFAPAGLSDPLPEVRHPASVSTEPAPGRLDLAFGAAVEAAAAGFAIDLASNEAKTQPSATIAVVGPDDEPETVVVEGVIPTGGGSRVERISAAVRLTRQAVDAWTSVIQPAGDEGRGDSL